jgi:asparagine synthase (glutamine-hydrolysing)
MHAEPGVGLVHTRLSLVDLDERRAQPFWDRSGRHCLLYNGELYDDGALRAELERHGAHFRTTSDTEVLLEAVLRCGVEAALPRLEGMFAFALFDAREKTLTLARDRFGITPLFVHDSDEAFVFASSVSAMRPWLPLRPDALMVSADLQGFNGPRSGCSFYDGVEILPPGAVVRIALGGRARFTQSPTLYDLPDRTIAEEFARRPRGELVDHVEQLLRHGVASQLCADVPVGAFCSGGVDSSLLMAMAARSHSDLRVFHADIVGPLSERAAAQRLSEHLKLELTVVAVRDQDFVEAIPDVVAHFGAPFVNPTTVPVLMVSRLVQEHGIKAVLTGEASDECFLGYEWLVPDVRASFRRLPQRVLGKLGLTRGAGGPGIGRDRELVMDLATGFEIAMGPAEFPDAPDIRYQAPNTQGLATDSNLSDILRTLLYRNDTMGMAASLESRFPFLDSRVVRAATHLPYDCQVRCTPTHLDRNRPLFRDTWIVREIAARYLPPARSQRPKGMFPTNAFQRMQIADALVEDSFVADWYRLAAPRMRRLLSQASPTLRLRLMLLDAWGQICIRGLPTTELRTRLTQHVTVAPQ